MSKLEELSRRDFFKTGALGGVSLFAFKGGEYRNASVYAPQDQTQHRTVQNKILDLSPAKWIWYPSKRCLQNSFFLFRREITLGSKPVKATGWIAADSRYLLFVNGQRIQWGPAPCDPRWLEADPLDLTDQLHRGKNIMAAQVLYYGQGDGTWPIGKPGFIFYLEVEFKNGRKQTFISDHSWLVHLAKSWPHGQFKRWYLRSLQEEFDARLYPYGWTEPEFVPGPDWLQAMELDCPADKPPLSARYPDYLFVTSANRKTSELRRRSIPLLKEIIIPAKRLAESHRIKWKLSPREYFEFLTPNAYEIDPKPCAYSVDKNQWQVDMNLQRAAVLTFEFEEQIVGWPYFTIEAPAGTIVELMVQEAHDPKNLRVMNNHFNSWSRFICKEGLNRFECFDYESLRWIQLHIRNASGRIRIKNVGVRRRIYPWPHQPSAKCSDPSLQKLLNASVNTLNNSAQDIIVDGMGRERQQYSGDCGHQLHAIFPAFGESRLPARYLNTFSQGLTLDGFFMDCWPAYDRLARLMERQLNLTKWGPLLDHGIGFNFDSYYSYLYTGDLSQLDEVFPRLQKFFDYLQSLIGKDGLLPVENIGIPAVWIDHDAYKQQRHKQCAFNLYAAAMARHAFAPLCNAFHEKNWARRAEEFSESLLKATQSKFWSEKHGLYINNLPWLDEEGGIRLCDRSLATAILFDQCPQGKIEPAVKALQQCPPEMGLSYPANAGWRLWALAKAGKIGTVLKEFRTRWMKMQSVHLNNTLQEGWSAKPDTSNEWSHCPVAPLYIFYMSIAGIQPIEPGYRVYQIRPQLGDLDSVELATQTIHGRIRLKARGPLGKRRIEIETLPAGNGLLVVDARESIDLPKMNENSSFGLTTYKLPVGQKVEIILKYS